MEGQAGTTPIYAPNTLVLIKSYTVMQCADVVLRVLLSLQNDFIDSIEMQRNNVNHFKCLSKCYI